MVREQGGASPQLGTTEHHGVDGEWEKTQSHGKCQEVGTPPPKKALLRDRCPHLDRAMMQANSPKESHAEMSAPQLWDTPILAHHRCHLQGRGYKASPQPYGLVKTSPRPPLISAAS